jgi:DNA invertase Pin-like site-specific DNA recombinase
MSENISPKQIAYSYARFSSAEQRDGNSLKRQLDMARKWCDSRQIELDESLVDEGISGFDGRNLEAGALGVFLEKCRNEEIPKKSILIVEAFDRLTRMKKSRAHKLFWELLEYVDLVVLRLGDDLITEDRVDEDDSLIYNIVASLNLSHMESKQKSDRLNMAWHEKRAKAEQGILMSEQIPAWFKVEVYDGKSKIDPKTQVIKLRTHRHKPPQALVSLIPERAKVVKDIFRWYTKGVPLRGIVKKLNQNGVETFGDSEFWRGSTISKYLNYHQAYGGYQLGQMRTTADGKRERVLGDVVKNYLPKVVSEKTWKSVQQVRQTGTFKGSRAEQNPLSSLCRCSRCGGGLKRKTYGPKKGRPKFLCSKHDSGMKCDFKPVIIEDAVEALEVFFARWELKNAWDAIADGSDKDKTRLLEIKKLLDQAVKKYPSTEISKLIFKLNEEKRKIELKRKHKVVGSEKGFLDAIDKFRESTIPQERNYALRKIIEKIIVYSKDDLEIHFKGGKKPIRANNLVKKRSSLSIKRKPKNAVTSLKKSALQLA